MQEIWRESDCVVADFVGQIFKGWPVDGGAMESEMGSGWMSIAPKPTCGPGAILQNYITFNHKGLIIRLAYVKRLYGL